MCLTGACSALWSVMRVIVDAIGAMLGCGWGMEEEVGRLICAPESIFRTGMQADPQGGWCTARGARAN